jgi:predicted permease
MAAGLRPPRLGRLLLWLARLGERRDEISADLEEQFRLRIREVGRWRAAWRHVSDAASVLRPSRRAVAGRRASIPSGVAFMWRDVLFAFRLVRRRPGLIGVTIAGLGLAIGASTAVFSLVSAAAFRSGGVTNPETVFSINGLDSDGRSRTWRTSEFRALRDRSTTTTVEAMVPESIGIGSRSESGFEESVPLHVVTGSYLSTFGATPVLGRLLTEADDDPGAPAVTVISEGFWNRRLGADPAVVGRSIALGDVTAVIVGVVGREFSGPTQSVPSLWVPFTVGETVRPYLSTGGYARLTGRIRSGVDPVAAEAELSGLVAADLAVEAGGRGRLTNVRLGEMDSAIGEARAIGLAVVGALALVLLLATANMANLLLANAAERHREVALRLALGAGRHRVAIQHVTEGLVFGVAGALAGFAAAVWLGPVFAELLQLPAGIDVRFDGRVYAFLVVVTMFVGGLAGLAPARFSLRHDLTPPMKAWAPAGAATSHRTRAALVSVQAATSILLLIATAVLARSAINAAVANRGFDPHRVLIVRPVHPFGLCDEPCAAAFNRAAAARLRAMPEVVAVGETNSPPMAGAWFPFIIGANGHEEVMARLHVTAEYASVMDRHIVRGRFFDAADVGSGRSVAVVTERAARLLWPSEEALGQPLDALGKRFQGFRVVGIVADAVNSMSPRIRWDGIYLPLTEAGAAVTLVVRTRSNAAAAVSSVHAAIASLDSTTRVTTRTMTSMIDDHLAPIHAIVAVASIVAVVALGLAVVGLYGVTAFVVGQRTQEIGVRMALGASGRDVARLLVRESLRPVAIGLVAGMVLAAAAGRLLTSSVLGVSPTDPASLAAAAGVLVLSALAAVVSPARRASRVDPATVLRQL